MKCQVMREVLKLVRVSEQQPNKVVVGKKTLGLSQQIRQSQASAARVVPTPNSHTLINPAENI